MSDADELLRAGDLQGARASLVETIKRAPADQPARLFLFQLLCLTGEWDKAKTHLRALTSVSPEAQMLAVNYNMAIDAELNRQEVFAGKAPAALLVGDSAWAGDLAAALGAQADGRVEEAETRRTLAFDAAPDTPGEIDGVAFEWIADADIRFGPAFEAIIAGRWGLVPFDAVDRIESEGPRDLRDLVWLPAQVHFRTGTSVNALLPTRYPGTETDGEDALKLARGTIWREEAWGQSGLGQHVWSLSDGSEVDLLSLRRLAFGARP
jgi:type VI secretion system protein ImpE